jgi:hypothetical protein
VDPSWKAPRAEAGPPAPPAPPPEETGAPVDLPSPSGR